MDNLVFQTGYLETYLQFCTYREDANGILDPNPDQNVLGNNVAEQIETENDDNDIIVIEDSYADSDCFTNNHVDFSELPAALDLNIDDEMENDIDENGTYFPLIIEL